MLPHAFHETIEQFCKAPAFFSFHFITVVTYFYLFIGFHCSSKTTVKTMSAKRYTVVIHCMDWDF